MEALRDYMHLPAVSSPVSDLSVPMERLDLADWHEELHDEIEWMREILLPEINQEYLKVCQVWFENPVSALEEDKKFLELTLEFLSLTRDDKIKWSKDDCFYFVRRIKSYLLHLRDLSYGNLVPGPQEQRNEEAVLTEPPSLRKWPRLAKQLDLMYEEVLCLTSESKVYVMVGTTDYTRERFQSLKDTYLPIISVAYGMYCKFFLKRGKKYRSLMLNFGFCKSFLRRPKDHLLLISMDAFDYYVRRIKLLVTGVEPMESWCSNNRSAGAKESLSNNDFRAASTGASLSASSNLFLYHGASSVSRVLFEMESADWHNELHKEIESMRKTDMGDIRKFYKIVRGMCHEGVELTAELEEDKIALEYALRFLSVSRAAKISLSKEECCVAVKTVRLYALRYRIEYRQHHHNPKQQEQGSRDSTCPVKGDGWLEELHNKIDSMRDKYLSEIEEAYRRVCIMPPESLGTTGIVRGDMFFLGTALNFLRTRRNDKEAELRHHRWKVVSLIPSENPPPFTIQEDNAVIDWVRDHLERENPFAQIQTHTIFHFHNRTENALKLRFDILCDNGDQKALFLKAGIEKRHKDRNEAMMKKEQKKEERKAAQKEKESNKKRKP